MPMKAICDLSNAFFPLVWIYKSREATYGDWGKRSSLRKPKKRKVILISSIELDDIIDFLDEMKKRESTVRWTQLGTGWRDIPVRFHRKIYRSKKYIDPEKIATREYELYKGQPKQVLQSELGIYSALLGGRSSMIRQTLNILTLFISIAALILSLCLNLSLSEAIPIIFVILPVGGGLLGIFVLLPSFGADRLCWREMHIRVIVLSYLLENDKKKRKVFKRPKPRKVERRVYSTQLGK